MHAPRPSIARLALPLLLAAVICAGCGANRPTAPSVARADAVGTAQAFAALQPSFQSSPDTGSMLTLTAEPSTGTTLFVVTFRGNLTSTDSPCFGERWDFGDGKAQYVTTAACAARPPSPSISVVTTYTKDYAYYQRGTYRVEFCLLRSENSLCATTMVQVR